MAKPTFKSVLVRMDLCPGDCLMLTSAIRDLKVAYPELQVNVKTHHPDVWLHNPYLTEDVTEENADKVIDAHYGLINHSNQAPFHFIHGYRLDLAQQLQLPIPAGPFKVDVHFSEEEKRTPVHPELKETRYWVLNAGYKFDYTLKAWEMARYQDVVDELKNEVLFVQVGRRDRHWCVHPHMHNVFDMTDQTSVRDVLRLIYFSAGVLTGPSFTALATTLPGPRAVIRGIRPGIIIGGGREPHHWQQMPGHFYLHRCGIMDCNVRGGCWKNRIVPLDVAPEKNDRICLHPVNTSSGQVIPLCMDLITVDEVVNLIRQIEQCWKLDLNADHSIRRPGQKPPAVSSSSSSQVTTVSSQLTTPQSPSSSPAKRRTSRKKRQ